MVTCQVSPSFGAPVAPCLPRSLVYPGGTTFASKGFVYDLRLENALGTCRDWIGPEATPRAAVASEVRFDNVRLDADAVAATE